MKQNPPLNSTPSTLPSSPSQVSKFNRVGTHCILELYDCSPDLLNDRTFINRILHEASQEANSTLLGAVDHKFHPQGITALALLAESHISIHTWPELGYAAVDIFTCGLNAQPERACDYLAQILEAQETSLTILPRYSQVKRIQTKYALATTV